MPKGFRGFQRGHAGWNKGKTYNFGEQAKKNMSDSKKRFYLNGGIPPRLGKKHSEETKKKISITKKSQPNKSPSRFQKGHTMSLGVREKIRNSLLGEKNYNWQGGLSKDRSRYRRLRRNRVKNVGGFHLTHDWETLKAQYNWTCPCCHRKEPEIKLTEDHIIPISKGGSDNIENIQPLCLSCNSRKYNKTIKYENGTNN